MQQTINKITYFLKWKTFSRVEAGIIGCVVALSALVLRYGIDNLGALRVHLCHRYSPLLVLPLAGIIGGVLCGLLIQFVASDITGSGIPKVKSYLHNNEVSLNIKVFLAKILGGILALGTGFALGKEGPTVQVGACTAYMLGRFKLFPSYNIKQMVASGAGAGLAAAFNAPLSGVLFVIEELLKDISGFTVGNTAIACFFASVISLALGNHRLDLNNSVILPLTRFSVTDVPFCILLGVGCGVLGASFNKSLIELSKLNTKILGSRFIIRLALAGLIVGIVIAFLPPSFRDYAGLRHLLLHGHTSFKYAITALSVNFFLTLVSYASGAPGGLFAPSLTLGCAFGYIIGLLEQLFIPGASFAATTLSYAGMAGMFSGIARVPITSMVIVFEITHDFNLFLPLMICSTVAYLVAEEMYPNSIYDRLLELDGINIPKSISESVDIKNIPCAKVMQKKLDTISYEASIEDALLAFKTSNHNELPVVKNKKIVGLLSREDLIKNASESNAKTIEKIYKKNPICVYNNDELKLAVDLFEHYKLYCLPVKAQDSTLLGIITRNDIFKIILDS